MRKSNVLASLTLAILREHFGPTINIPFAAAAQFIGIAPQTARNQITAANKRRKGYSRFPLPTYLINGRRFVNILTLAAWCDAKQKASVKRKAKKHARVGGAV